MLFTENDAEAQKIFQDFLPNMVFDAHMHLYTAELTPSCYDPNGVFWRKVCTISNYKDDIRPFFHGIEEIRVNAIPMPDRLQTDTSNGLRKKMNAYIQSQVMTFSDCVGAAYIMPTDSEEEIWKMTAVPGIKALKCYCFTSGKSDVEHCSLDDYLPESAWCVANQRKMPIILHMMRPKALSDDDNFSYITAMTKKYPQAQLILAHCARSFASWTIVNRIRQLEDQGNIWFDMAAICESVPIMACIMKNAGKRTMWGTDYPLCMKRGRVISMGDDFGWFTEMDFPVRAKPCAILSESLLAFWQAARIMNLDQTQINDIFYRNAMSLFLKR